MARKYELKKRAEKHAETRRRITAAAVELHSTVGPARTTIAAIAERAGVQRLTVYKHFPNEKELFSACTALSWERSPGPDPAGWRAVAQPEQRLRLGLQETYAYMRSNRQLLANVRRDLDRLPVLRWSFAKFRAGWLADCRAALQEPWPAPQPRELGPAIVHATDFSTWESLENAGLDDEAKVGLMVLLVKAVVVAPKAGQKRAAKRAQHAEDAA